jgi:hypothetical protein
VLRAASLVLAVLAASAPLSAQQAFDTALARRYVSVLADDSLRGRLTGSPGARAAAEFIAAQAKDAGLLPAGDSGTYLQRVPLERPQWSDSSTLTLTVGGKRVALRWGTDFVAFFGRPGTRGPADAVWGDLYTAEGVAATYRNAAGKFVVIDVPEGKGLLVQGVPAKDPPLGIIALFAAPHYGARASRAVLPRRVRFAATAADTGGLVVLFVDRDSLVARLGALPPGAPGTAAPFGVALGLHETTTPVPAWNVLAIRPGRDSARGHQLVALGAHYDHFGRAGDPQAFCRPAGADSTCNGADDNASGVAASLLAARALAHAPATARPVLFAWHTAAELGRLGSRWLAVHPPAGDTIVAEADLDGVGASRGDTLLQSGAGWMASALARALDSANAELPAPYRWDRELDARDRPMARASCRFDQASYQNAGIPAVLLSAGPTPRFDRADDETAFVDAGQVARVARLATGLLRRLADAPDRPAPDQPPAPPLCPDPLP